MPSRIKKIIATVALYSASLISLASCIHVDSQDQMALNLPQPQQEVVSQKLENLNINTLIYHPTLYPLESSVRRLLSGELRESLERIDFSYQKANFDSDALTELIAEGLIPVYVKIENTQSTPFDLKRLALTLHSGKSAAPALNEKDLPRALKRVNYKAVGANIYNTAAVVVGTTAAFVAVAVIAAQSASPCCPDLNYPFKEFKNQKIYNPIIKKTTLTYESYLFQPTVLKEKESAQGLLFFDFQQKPVDPTDLRLDIKVL
jgi:hypothetical protein